MVYRNYVCTQRQRYLVISACASASGRFSVVRFCDSIASVKCSVRSPMIVSRVRFLRAFRCIALMFRNRSEEHNPHVRIRKFGVLNSTGSGFVRMSFWRSAVIVWAVFRMRLSSVECVDLYDVASFQVE